MTRVKVRENSNKDGKNKLPNSTAEVTVALTFRVEEEGHLAVEAE